MTVRELREKLSTEPDECEIVFLGPDTETLVLGETSTMFIEEGNEGWLYITLEEA